MRNTVKPNTATEIVQMPHNLEAEEAVIGGLLIDPCQIEKLAFLKQSDFYSMATGIIYGAMLTLYNRREPCSIVAVCDELDRQGKLQEVRGASAIALMVNATPTASATEQHARIIERAAMCRRLVRAGQQIAALGFDQPADLDEARTKAESALYDIWAQRLTGRIIVPSERASRAYARYEAAQRGQRPGIPYGFHDLDGITQGAQPGQLVLVAGRPSMGKTSLMQCSAERMAHDGHKVLFCSAEMAESDLTDRAVAGRINRSVHALQEGYFGDEIWQSITDVLAQQIGEDPLYVYDDADMTTSSIRAVATEMRSRTGLDALFVDYLQILHDGYGKSDNERVGYISRQLKAIARHLSVPVIVGSQLNRECEDRRDKKPALQDLRDSGTLEQDADVVMLLYRVGFYWQTIDLWKKVFRDESYPGANVTQVIIAKQRQGRRGVHVKLLWEGTTMQFEGVDEHHDG